MELWRKVFINRNYGLLFTGRLVSQLGDGIHYFAMVWLVLDLTGSGAALGTLLMAASIPGIALAPFSGVLADMWNRKKIIVGMDVIRGLLVLGLAGFHAFGVLTLPLLYIVTILLSLCGTLFSPAVSASVPGLVRKDQLVTANAREAFANSATGILGPILGAMLLGAFGTLAVFLLNGVSFLVSAASEACIEFPPPRKQNTRGQGWGRFLQNLKDGFSFLWNFDGLKVLIGGGLLLNFMFSPLFGSLMQVAAPLGMGLFGVLLDLIPIHFFFLFCGLAAVAVAIGFAISRAMFILCQRREDFEQGLGTVAVELKEQETCV